MPTEQVPDRCPAEAGANSATDYMLWECRLPAGHVGEHRAVEPESASWTDALCIWPEVPDQQQREVEIRARAEAATPGPWSACGEDRGGCQCAQVGCADGPVCDVTRGDWGDTWPEIRLVDDPNHMGKHAEAYIEMGVYGNVPIDIAAANQAFIAHAREDIPYLLDALDREREANRELREALMKVETEHCDQWCAVCLGDDGGARHVEGCYVARALLHPESTGQEDEG